MGFSRQELEWVACPPPGNFPDPETKPRYPALQADPLLSEPQGKPKNIGVHSLSLFQGILSDQGIEPGFPALQVSFLPAELPGKPITSLKWTNW